MRVSAQTQVTPSDTQARSLTVIDVAKILRVNPKTVYREIQRGHLGADKTAVGWHISDAQLTAYLGD